MKNMIFIGAQGAGKGTYADVIKAKLDIPHISTGDMFREAIKDQTPLGVEAKKHIDGGNLVPDEVTIKLVEERLLRADCKNGFILDGFPRTLPQAQALDKITQITQVVFLEVREEVIMQRLGGRIQCRKCSKIFHKTNMPPKVEGVCDMCGGELYTRDDDKPEAIKKRLAIFQEQTAPLLNFYEEKGVVIHVDSNDPIPSEVVKDIMNKIG
ncbi:MAG: adenylate kinase [Candidatus Woesearchaeota archaeon]